MNWTRHLPNNWRRLLPGSPFTQVEDSICLRVLVLALVIVGIIASDIAAETKFSFWAVPLSVVGGMWSYRSRRRQNLGVKFCIAIGMLIALGAFLGRLLGELNDTRLVLAQLLIQLQVLHSFDMPRRKDLGYSMTIGIILLGVAATLSQTLAFAPVLLIFLVIALPTLWFDYRSRIGLNQFKVKNEFAKGNTFPLRFLIINFFAVLGIGLLIFAALPRFPGYGLRTFPVSSAMEIKGDFSGRKIINPGYVRQGNSSNSQSNNGSSSGQNQGQPGKLDDNFYYGFNTTINQNLRGQEMKPKVVMRVRSQAEGFWRVLAFDRYTGKGWEISRNDSVMRLKRSPWSYQTFINLPQIITKTKEVIQTYTVVSELPNLIPAMAYPREMYFPTPMIAVDPEGGLRSPLGLSKGLTYTVISEVPLRDRTLLGLSSTKYPQSIKDNYLQLPAEITDKVRQYTEGILADYNRQRVGQTTKSLDSAYEKALYLAQYLKQNYTIPQNPLDLPYFGENEDLVEAFLFKHRGGYPDHFSTTLTVMLRSIGIPARLVAGFNSGKFNPFTGMYVVRNTDAFAMTEVYFPKYGWFAFDPIPNHPLIPPSVDDPQTFSVLRQFWHQIAGWLPSPVTGWLNKLFGTIYIWITKLISWFFALFTQGALGIVTGLMVLTSIAGVSWLSWTKWNHWRSLAARRKLAPMEKLYQQMLAWMAQKGLGKHPAQTPLEYAHWAHQHYSPATARVIEEIAHAYVSWRYGGLTPQITRLQKLWQETTNS